jgi:four helix bundle protein
MKEGTSAFEELAVYQRARALTNEVYRLTRAGCFARDWGLIDQMRRAAVSILSNIAEGFERGGNPEFIQFLYVAKGSCGEVRAQLMIAADQKYIDSPTHDRLQGDCRRISAMLANLITYLRRSPMKGAKFAATKLSKESQSKLNPRHSPAPPNS